MKWQAASLVAFFGSASLASPINPVAARDDGLDIYRLRISTNSDKSLDGKYLGSFNNTIGVFNDAMAVQFYTVNGGKPGHVELHTYPIGIVDHALALRGAGEQLDFLNVVNPATIPVPAGEIYDWTSFSLAADPEDAGKPANCLDYAAGEDGRWVAVPSGNEGEWSVKWQGADGVYLDWYMPINIVYESVEDDVL